MNPLRLLFLGIVLASQVLASGPELGEEKIEISGFPCMYRLSVRTAVFPSLTSETKADVFYLHGFADHSLNHQPYFKSLQEAGYRVIAFDFPGHGETTGSWLGRIRFGVLAKIAAEIERRTLEDEARPLIVSGWSTGGLLGYRMQQGFFPQFKRKVEGLILFAPGNYVKLWVGERNRVTIDTLTSNPQPPFVSAPKPDSPIKAPIFAGSLFINSLISRRLSQPKLPILVMVAGEQDRYVRSAKLVQFYRDHDPDLTLIREFPNSLHAIDAEVDSIALPAIQEAVGFANAIVGESIAPYIRDRQSEFP